MNASHQISKKEKNKSVYVEYAKVLDIKKFPAEQYIIRLHAPKSAKFSTPGSFIHLQCGSMLLRRPFSIMLSSKKEGWIDILYKVVGDGTKSLSSVKIGDSLSLMGPIGRGFTLNKKFDLPLLLGGGLGIPPIVFLAKLLKSDKNYNPLVLMGSEIPFPFTTQPSAIMLKGLPNDVIAGMPLMESWQVASRLCSKNNFPGCYEGYVDEFARIWLNSLEQAELSRVAIFSCGPEPMLKAVASLAKEFSLPCQISLEEHMACAVGGCAGCNVKVYTEKGESMQRVCVDGPVFFSEEIYG